MGRWWAGIYFLRFFGGQRGMNVQGIDLPPPPCGQELTSVDLLSSFVRLRFVDLSRNVLTSLAPLAPLAELLTLTVDENEVRRP